MGAKAKISITLSEELLQKIDDEVALSGDGNRSSVIERWLRRAERTARMDKLREDTLRYYESLADEDAAEDEAVARATSKAARRVRYD